MQTLSEHGQGNTSHGKRWKLWGSFILLLVLATAGYFVWQSATEEREATPVPAPPPEPPPEPEPEPPPPPTPTVGSLVVSSTVPGAKVFVNDEEVGNAPFSASSLEPGSYRIRVEKEGYQPFERQIRVSAGERARLRADLAKLTALLRIDSDVAGATVFLDRNYLGTTPLEVKNIEPGEHELTASVEGYDMYAEAVDVPAEPMDIQIRFKEVKLDETVAVVHKHTFGQCQGILHATLTHVTYETDHKDAFSVPWAALERFDVDYMDKNLNLKVRGGKNYNFTSESGNPDDLFVFHQSVTEAREKLKSMN